MLVNTHWDRGVVAMCRQKQACLVPFRRAFTVRPEAYCPSSLVTELRYVCFCG